MHVPTAIWLRLDVPGHDACWVERSPDGWTVGGVTVFQHEMGPAALRYRVDCTTGWVTRSGEVRGRVGSERVELAIERDRDGRWTLNDVEASSVAGLIDLDFGFTPATNFQQLRRLALGVGESANINVAWIDVDSPALSALAQRYERRNGNSYWYESPSAGYEALLVLRADGLIEEYPRLWRALEPGNGT